MQRVNLVVLSNHHSQVGQLLNASKVAELVVRHVDRFEHGKLGDVSRQLRHAKI